jgi:hypothetical protein
LEIRSPKGRGSSVHLQPSTDIDLYWKQQKLSAHNSKLSEKDNVRTKIKISEHLPRFSRSAFLSTLKQTHKHHFIPNLISHTLRTQTSQANFTAMADTSPKSQNISESDFFKAYKAPHLRLKYISQPKVVSKAAPKVTSKVIQVVTPPRTHSPEPSRTFNGSFSKLSPSAAPFTAPRTPSPKPTQTLNRSSSNLSPTAPPFTAPTSLSQESIRVTSSCSSSSKLSPNAAPFTMPAPIAPKLLNEEDALTPVQRVVIVGGNSGPWPQYGVPCNDENLVTVTGLHQDDLEFDDCVSEAGLEDQPRQVVRATEGEDSTNQLVDWDGEHWAPAPASWEHDRAEFNGVFIPNYIREWAESVPFGKSVTVDTSNEAFLIGKATFDNDVLIAPLSQPTIVRSKSLCAWLLNTC